MNTLGIFPAELVYNILSHADPRDIIRWRTVSKGFCALTYDTLLWKALYANVPFSRPSSQSIESIQRELVKSAKLAESWTTRPMRNVLSPEIRISGKIKNPLKLVGGRWLITCESEKKFVLHDVDAGVTTHARRVLWEQENHVFSWDVAGMPSVGGKYSVYVMFEIHSLKWNLLEFSLDERSGEPHDFVLVDVPSSKRIMKQEFNLHGTPPFLHIPTVPRHVVFDTRTRIFHEVPQFRIMQDEIRAKTVRYNSLGRVRCAIFTNNHLIYFRYILTFTVPRYLTLVQAFTLPTDGSLVGDGNHVIRLTHEGILSMRPVTNILELLKSSVDPTTGDTNVYFLEHLAGAQIMRYDITLPKPPSLDVVPITVETQVFHLPNRSALMEHYDFRLHYGNLFDDGHARCFYGALPKGCDTCCAANTHIMKYTIDTTREPWVFDFGELLPERGNPIAQDLDDDYCMFDGLRGKLCFIKRLNEYSQAIFVADVE